MAREIASVSTADANTDVKLNYSSGQLKPPHQSRKPSCASSTPSTLFFLSIPVTWCFLLFFGRRRLLRNHNLPSLSFNDFIGIDRRLPLDWFGYSLDD